MLEIPNMVFCPIKRGAYIFEQGDAVERIYYLVKGCCYRQVLTDKGDDIIYGIKQAGNLARALVGVINIYGGGIYGASFVAQTDCEGYYVPKKDFLAYAKDKPELLTALLTMSAEEHYELCMNLQSRQEGRVGNRLCQILLAHSKDCDEKIMVDKALTNVLLGRLLGIHHVTVAKIIRYLKCAGIIKRTTAGLEIIDKEQLENYGQGKTFNYYQ